MQKKQILIVEDNELNRSILKGILEDEYHVLEAEHGQAALEVLAKHHESISVILLDVIMPVMDGYALLHRLKADPQLAMIPVIIMTQGNSEEDELAALANGATDFLSKPYRSQIILHRVAGLIRLRESSAMANLYKYDRLTGFYSKEYFYQKARAQLDENPDTDYVIVCSNIENFKLYNDAFGRESGNRLLAQHAKTLQQRMGENALCGRYGADRLLFLLEKQYEQELRRKFQQNSDHLQYDKIDNMFVKFGVYTIDDHTVSVEQMCDRALLAVDSIKGLYHRNIVDYNDSIRAKMLREKDITDVMECSLNEGQFEVYFQPKYNLNNDHIIGAEALVRWIHPDLGFLSPGEFIPLFEQNGFIHNVDQFVWESVCQKLRRWQDQGLPLVPISVNVSRSDIYQQQLAETFRDLVTKYEIDPKYLHLEITESAYAENPDRIVDTVEQLRKLGFVIEMDDFGSGYSSLNMLSQMSIDILKLDMAFIRSEMAKPIERRLLNDVVNMAHRMNLRVVAEGVETESQRDRLRAMGCDFAQGYFYAKPMPEQEYVNLLCSCIQQVDPTAHLKRQSIFQRNGLYEGSAELLQKLYAVSDVLPIGFFMYKAGGGEELISFNKEVLNLYGCRTEEEFRELTGNSFRGMVHPDDLAMVESDISTQIQKENDIDHVQYRIVCKDKSEKLVRDYGRFVHSDIYGDIYYVLIHDIAGSAG